MTMPKNRSKKSLTSGIIKPLFSDTKDLTFLGKTQIPATEVPSIDLLETFANPAPGRKYEICFSTSEFTSMCPVTGQPDFATITLRYTPNKRCVESKAYKLYLRSFRNQGVFGEAIVNRMLDDLVAVLDPYRITVIGDFSARGGIGLRVEASHLVKKKSLKKKTKVS